MDLRPSVFSFSPLSSKWPASFRDQRRISSHSPRLSAKQLFSKVIFNGEKLTSCLEWKKNTPISRRVKLSRSENYEQRLKISTMYIYLL